MNKKVLVFCAEYLVFFSGGITFLLALQQETLERGLIVFSTASIILVLALGIQKILKRVFRKNRPKKEKELFFPFDQYAFPSGHATGLSVLTFYIFEKSLSLGIISLVILLLVSFARIQVKAHDHIDILAGIILGVSVAYFTSSCIEQVVSSYTVTHMF